MLDLVLILSNFPFFSDESLLKITKVSKTIGTSPSSPPVPPSLKRSSHWTFSLKLIRVAPKITFLGQNSQGKKDTKIRTEPYKKYFKLINIASTL